MFYKNQVDEEKRDKEINVEKYYNALVENHFMVPKSNSLSAFMYELMLDCLTINDYMDLSNKHDIQVLNDTFVNVWESHKDILETYKITEQMMAHFMIYTIKNLRRYKCDIPYLERRGTKKFAEDCIQYTKATGTEFIQEYCNYVTHSGNFNINMCLNWLSVLRMVKIPIYFRFQKKTKNEIVSSESIMNIREFISDMIIFDYRTQNVLNIKELYSGYKLYTEDESIDFKSFRTALIEIGLIGSKGKYIRNVKYTRNGCTLFNLILPATKENELIYD